MAHERELEVLYEAFHSEYGVEVELLGNFQISLQRLYAARRTDPDLDILQISKSPHSQTHVWIVKTDRPSPEQGALKENPKGEGDLFTLSDLLGDD